MEKHKWYLLLLLVLTVFSLHLPLVLLMSDTLSTLVSSLLVCTHILCRSLAACWDLHCLVGSGADG